MEETGQTRFLSYHRNIERSQNFAARLGEIYGTEGFTVAHVDGSSPLGRAQQAP
jgi:hypothetical protein